MDIFDTLTSDEDEKMYMEGRLLFDFGIICSEKGAKGFDYRTIRSGYKTLLDYDYGNEEHLLALQTLGSTVVGKFGELSIPDGLQVHKEILRPGGGEKMPTCNYMQAIRLATLAHHGQLRRYHSGVPYIVHPLRVAQAIADVPERELPDLMESSALSHEELMVAAILHDTLEDTDMGIAVLTQYFGRWVTEMVTEVTNPSSAMPKTVPRKERKRADFEHIAAASMAAKIIKLEDRIDNLLDAPMYISDSRSFLKNRYIGESKALYGILKDVHGSDRLAFAIELSERRIEIFEKIVALEKVKFPLQAN